MKNREKKAADNANIIVAKQFLAHAQAIRFRAQTDQATAALFWEHLFDRVVRTGELPSDLKAA